MNLERLCVPAEITGRPWMAQPFLVRVDDAGKTTIWRVTTQGHFLFAERVADDTPGQTVDPKNAGIIAGWIKTDREGSRAVDVEKFSAYCGGVDWPVICPKCKGEGEIGHDIISYDQCSVCGGLGQLSSYGGKRVIRVGKIDDVLFNREYMARLLFVSGGAPFRIKLTGAKGRMYLFGSNWMAVLVPISHTNDAVVPYTF